MTLRIGIWTPPSGWSSSLRLLASRPGAAANATTEDLTIRQIRWTVTSFVRIRFLSAIPTTLKCYSILLGARTTPNIIATRRTTMTVPRFPNTNPIGIPDTVTTVIRNVAVIVHLRNARNRNIETRNFRAFRNPACGLSSRRMDPVGQHRLTATLSTTPLFSSRLATESLFV